jgi:hypothetical protein
LTSDALIFGRNTLTASDIIVAAGRADFGERGSVGNVPPTLVVKARARIMEMVANAVERARLSPEPLPVIAVRSKRRSDGPKWQEVPRVGVEST